MIVAIAFFSNIRRMRSTLITYLFVPGDRPERFAKAITSGTDITVFDLEDAVAPDAKNEARQSVAAAVSDGRRANVCVRINAAGTPWFHDDLNCIKEMHVQSVMVPKAEDPDELARIGRALAGVPLIPLIETAIGLDRARDLARMPGVQRLAFGTVDFQVDLGVEGDGDELLLARSQLVLASRLAGLAPPVDGVTLDAKDPEKAKADAVRSRRLGFGGKLCIHPLQIDPVHAAFLPTMRELERARALLRAAEAQQRGVFTFEGRLVDKPVIDQARKLVARA